MFTVCDQEIFAVNITRYFVMSCKHICLITMIMLLCIGGKERSREFCSICDYFGFVSSAVTFLCMLR